jgi:hypothetical protein
VIYLIIAFAFGIAGGYVGRMKGSSFFIWFLISACVPFIGLMAALAYRWDTDELLRQCPRCGRVVKLHDALCMGCGHELEFPGTESTPPPTGAPRVPAGLETAQ